MTQQRLVEVSRINMIPVLCTDEHTFLNSSRHHCQLK